MKILLANPHGFCAGVVMAIESLEKALELYGAPIFVFHEIVHNKHVVERFRRRGVVFVTSIDEIPEQSHLLYSAHGVSPEIRRQAQTRRLNTIDATCPLVSKVHLEARRFAAADYTVIFIGHAGHDEAVGTLGEAPNQMRLVETVEDVDRVEVVDPEKVAYLTQTTLSVDDANRIIERLKQHFPQIVGPNKQDICYATQNRQDAVKALLPEADVVLVLGSRNSSNSNRLAEIAQDAGKPAYLIDNAREINPDWLRADATVLVTAGASAPEPVVDDCLAHLQQRFGATVEDRRLREEHARFPLPIELRRPMAATMKASPTSHASPEDAVQVIQLHLQQP
jgi:4-hydroxy-3-methylbut-2-enyl diphosphate reductase